MTTLTSSQPVQVEQGRQSPLLRIEDLAVSFDGPSHRERIRAVEGVRLSIYPGQTLAVVGESGCGKSVTAMSTLRLIPSPPSRIERGRVMFRPRSGGDEVDLLALGQSRLREVRGNEIAMIFQEPMTSLNPVFTVGEQILEAIRLHQNVGKSEAAAAAIQAMREVGIPEPERRLRQYPHQFSGGMRQRIMIAMALACRPMLLLADEPTTALDVTIQAQILELLRGLQRSRGMAIMLITHALGVVAESADVVCVMYAGRVVEYATVPELFSRPLHPYTRGLLACIPRMGERRGRLVTIKEVVDDPGQFQGLPGANDGVRPWWPGHGPPEGLVPGNEPPGDSVLLEVEPGHWVAVWRTGAAAARHVTEPDLSFRMPETGLA